MRDRDAERKATEAHAMLGNIADLLPRVRRNLRTWASGGYPAGAGESSLGSDRHSDPTARAITATEITDKTGNHTGWRDLDPFGQRLNELDRRLEDIYKRVRDLDRDFRELDYRYEGVGDLGCDLCGAVRQPVNAATGKAEHECSPACAKNDHRHPNGWQRIHNRTAPKLTDELDPLTDRARCSFHYDFAERYGTDAHTDIALWHLDHPGQRVPLSMIKTHHLDEFTRHHAARSTA